jgi:hypothetical protein
MQELRWLEKQNGDNILQFKRTKSDDDWTDIPRVKEDVKNYYFVLTCEGGYLSDIPKGIGKKRVCVCMSLDNAKQFSTDLEVRIYMQEHNLSLYDYEIDKYLR